MMSKPGVDASAVDVRVGDDALHVVTADGRELAAPLAWFPRLRDATAQERAQWQIIGRGCGIHMARIDENMSVASLLRLS